MLLTHECGASCQLARGHRSGLRALALRSAIQEQAQKQKFSLLLQPPGGPNTDLDSHHLKASSLPCVLGAATPRALGYAISGH